MKKTKERKQQEPPKECLKYPSAELLQTACFEDYKQGVETYDKIYDKINTTLAFCGIILLVIISSFDYTLLLELMKSGSNLELFALIVYFLFSLISVVFIVWSVIQLLLLMHSREVVVFDSIAVRNDEVYRLLPDEAALWLIDKYTYATNELRKINNEKHKKYNAAIIKIVIALLSYTVVLILKKGM